MTERMLKVLPLGVFGSLLVALAVINTAPAQEPIPLRPPGAQPPEPIPLPLPGQPAQPAQGAQGDGIEVLAKGPVHEAFATTAEAPAATPIVAKQPPAPIEELPPDQKPEGDNVQWIPGYWGWDEENNQFIWISGFWRQPPPGRVWVPGAWREAQNGWQYVPGFWQELAPQQPQQPQLPQVQPEIEYLPQPPQSLEIGPTVAAPSTTSVYVPGAWVWRNRYVWRPGVWVEYRANWVWVPARYHWTPAGYVFSDGYWDYPLATRGVLFAPVVFTRPVYVRPAFVYTPVYVVSEPCMTGALFVRRGYGNYYFGDYFDARYARGGYSAWCGVVTRNGFSIGFGVGRTWGYDPLWSYYSVHHRSTPRWQGSVSEIYAGRYKGDVARPPTTLVQQNTVINRITQTNVTNVTNNITVVNGAPTVGRHNVANVAMVAPLKVAPDLQRTKFESVTADRRREEATAARQIRDVGVQRTRLETAVSAKPQPGVGPGTTGTPPAARPQTIKLDVPKAAVNRARVASDKAPPPNPLHTNPSGGTGTGAKIGPPKVEPRPPVPPKADPPRVGQPMNPAGNPVPKVDPKVPTNPMVNPQPRVDPKGPANPPARPQPKVDPRPPMNPPRVEPKQGTPPPTPPANPPARPQPKVDPVPPPAPKVNPPVTPPAGPKVDPKPMGTPPARPRPTPPPAPKVNPPAPPAQSRPARAPVIQPNPAPVPVVPPAARPAPAPTAPPAARPAPAPTAPPAARPAPVPVVPPAARPASVPPRPQPAPMTRPRPSPAPAVQPAPRPVVAPPAQPRPAAAPPTAPPRQTVQPPT
ncbi:MAG TPA: hypothetical protein VGE74_06535, partial [Gemmata sp.]